MFLRMVAACVLLAAPASAQSEQRPDAIDVTVLGGGRLFTTADGMTLYTYKSDAEQPGTSTCTDQCADEWPPVLAATGSNPVGDWTLITREGGSLQWAYQGRPAYTHKMDTHPGSIAGSNVSRSWDVLYEPVATPPNVQIVGSVIGQTLADLRGHTVYTGPKQACSDTCMNAWQPVEAPWVARPVGEDWTISEREDGLRQWAFKGQPLFTYNGDFTPDDRYGLRAPGGWSVAVLHDSPAVPDWVTVQETDIGPVLATADRMTMYYLVSDWDEILKTMCDTACVEANWDPVLAPENVSPIGNWTTTRTPDGQNQWVYQGRAVYTFRGDEIPGDTYGDKFGTGSDIRGGWIAILEETLIQNLAG